MNIVRKSCARNYDCNDNQPARCIQLIAHEVDCTVQYSIYVYIYVQSKNVCEMAWHLVDIRSEFTIQIWIEQGASYKHIHKKTPYGAHDLFIDSECQVDGSCNLRGMIPACAENECN